VPCGGTFRMTFRSKLTLQVQRTPAPTPGSANGGIAVRSRLLQQSDLAPGLARRGQVAERRHLTGEVLRSALGEAELSELLDGGADVG
jgi:hypothetical protein